MVSEYEAVVAEVVTETPETKSFRLLPKMDFKPGQFVMITIDIPSEGPITRAYSISSSPEDDKLEITIRKKEDGFVSKYIDDNLKVGDKVRVKGPFGTFVLNDTAKKIGFIAGGCGIAPFRSMWRHIQQSNLKSDIVLLFSSKTEETIVYRRELDQGGFRVVHTLTRNENPAWKGATGRISKEMLREVFPDFNERFFYICGPPPMSQSSIDALKELGVDEKNIQSEKFD